MKLARPMAGLAADAGFGDLEPPRLFDIERQPADMASQTVGIEGSVDPLRVDRPLLQGDVDRAQQLVPVEGLALAAALEHGQLAQLDAFEGGEARGAVRALPTPPDRRVVLGRPRILDLGILVSAERATHPISPCLAAWY